MARKRKPLVRPVKNPAVYAQCRSLGHEWRHKGHVTEPADQVTRPFKMSWGVVGLRSECVDCHTQRIKWLTNSGETITRYRHPEGYSLHGDEKLTSKQWRSQFVTRLFETELSGAVNQ